MKLYSKKNLFYGLICLGIVIHQMIVFEGLRSVMWIGFGCWCAVSSIRAAFSKEALEKAEQMRVLDEIARKQLMGPLWRVPEFLALGLCVVGAGLYALIPNGLGAVLLILCFVGATVYAMWFNSRYRELIKQLEQDAMGTSE